MTDIPLSATHRAPARLGRMTGPFLAALLAMVAASALPEWRPEPSDPTPIEEWHGNAATFHSAPRPQGR